MVISRPADAGTDLEGEFSNSNLMPITLKTPDVIQTPCVRTPCLDTGAVQSFGLFRSRLTTEDLQAVGFTEDPATWTEIYNPLFIVSAEATYP